MPGPLAINDKADLPNVSGTDRIMVARANQIYRADVRDMPNRISPRLALVPPTLSDFSTILNQSSSRHYNIDDGVRIWAPYDTTTGSNLMGRSRAIPGGSWDVQIGAVRCFTFINFQNAGMFLRESGTGKIVVNGFGVPNSDHFHVQYYTAPTTFSANLTSAQEKNTAFGFFRAAKNGSNIDYYYSTDGVCWAKYLTEALTAHFTTAPDQWGFYLENNNSGLSVNAAVDIIHWDE